MCKFESLQKDESRAHSADSTKFTANLKLLTLERLRLAGPFLAINRQPLELESCSNPLQIQQVL